MPTIPAHLGQRDPLISILRSGIRRDPKHRKKQIVDLEAIERFKQANGAWVYVATPITKDLIGKPDQLKAYLEKHRSHKGSFQPTATKWTQGTKYSGSKESKATARASAIPDYTGEISGNLDHKSTGRIKRIIRQAEQANQEFLNDLLPGRTPSKP